MGVCFLSVLASGAHRGQGCYVSHQLGNAGVSSLGSLHRRGLRLQVSTRSASSWVSRAQLQALECCTCFLQQSDWFCSPGQLAPSSHEVLPAEALTTCPAGDELPVGEQQRSLSDLHRSGNECLQCLQHIQTERRSHIGTVHRASLALSGGVSGQEACCAANCSLHMFQQIPLNRH